MIAATIPPRDHTHNRLGIALLSGCGGDDPPGWAEACATASARIDALPQSGSRTRLGLIAGATAVNLRDLAATLRDRPSGGDAAAAANRRNGVAATAVGFDDLAASIRGIGTGGRARVERDVAAAYDRIDVAARDLGLPECSAEALGSTRFTRLQEQATSQKLEESPASVAAHACARLRQAYGITSVPVDAAAASTQLRRSRDVLSEIIRDVQGRTDRVSVRLRSAARFGVATLTAADRRLATSAKPGLVALLAIKATTVRLRGAYAASGVRCPALAAAEIPSLTP